MNEQDADLRHRVRLALSQLDELLKMLEEKQLKLKSAEVDCFVVLMKARQARVAVKGIQTTT